MPTQNNLHLCRNPVFNVHNMCPCSLCMILPPIRGPLSFTRRPLLPSESLTYYIILVWYWNLNPYDSLHASFSSSLIHPPSLGWVPGSAVSSWIYPQGLGPDTVFTAWEVVSGFFFHLIFPTVIFRWGQWDSERLSNLAQIINSYTDKWEKWDSNTEYLTPLKCFTHRVPVGESVGGGGLLPLTSTLVPKYSHQLSLSYPYPRPQTPLPSAVRQTSDQQHWLSPSPPSKLPSLGSQTKWQWVLPMKQLMPLW